MHRFNINFRQSAADRAAQISTRAYNHYLRFKPYIGKIYKPFREIHDKYLGKFYGQSKKGTSIPR